MYWCDLYPVRKLLVTTQTSRYSKDRVQMLTDEGGILGAVMFLTWFFSIVTQ